MNRFVLFLLAFAIAGCSKPPVSTANTDNPKVPVSKLFTHDGCAVYRFEDGGRPQYYVRCLSELQAIVGRG